MIEMRIGPSPVASMMPQTRYALTDEGVHVAYQTLGDGPVDTPERWAVNGKAGGLAVMIGARIGALAGPSEILTSQTVRELTAGSGFQFRDWVSASSTEAA